jgi:hypothetical protein
MTQLDPFLDPSAPIDLCECGAVLDATDPDECFDCRLARAEVHEIPTWPLWVAVIVMGIFSSLIVPLAWATFQIWRG